MSIPVQLLDRRHLPALREHFAALDTDSRHRRFGSALSPAALDAYVDTIDFDADAVFGVLADDLSLIGVAHLPSSGDSAELGLSVLASARGRGVGSALFRRAVVHARNRQVGELYMHCLAENAVIMAMARRAGMRVVIDHSEADAWLELPPATASSLGEEATERQMALFDATLKSQVAQARRFADLFTRALSG